jgi:hypothetical protein
MVYYDCDSSQRYMVYYDCDIDTHPFEREVLKVPQYDTIEKAVLHLGLYKYARDGLGQYFQILIILKTFLGLVSRIF